MVNVCCFVCVHLNLLSNVATKKAFAEEQSCTGLIITRVDPFCVLVG